ncbi:hypothetical protein ABT033_09955 [Streptomyces pharetrae]|uniref:ATP-dependent DNA ligase n=1 Tax=Streptomyces pharetrae TaxID=291370 RepID=UPI00336361D7
MSWSCPSGGRLDFGELQRRARPRSRSAAEAAIEFPAHLIVFNVSEADGVELLARPYRHRRAVLEERFARREQLGTVPRSPSNDHGRSHWQTCPARGRTSSGGRSRRGPGHRVIVATAGAEAGRAPYEVDHLGTDEPDSANGRSPRGGLLDGDREAQPLHRAAIAADESTALIPPVKGQPQPDLGFLRGVPSLVSVAAVRGSERRLTEPWPVVIRCVSARIAAAAIT